MPRYRIYHLKEAQRQHFQRAAPGASSEPPALKRKDYQPGGEIEAPSPYAAWKQARESEHPIAVGDALETDAGVLLVCKYAGFEEARWWVPEPAAPTQPPPEPPLVPNR